MTQKTPAAFMSYVHLDDKYGHLTTLRERLSDEVHVQTGIQFPIFQDRKDIQWGQNWRERIENSLDETTFLVPIITPSFFRSKACRSEFERFIEREKKLDRTDLILPIYFVDTPLLNAAELRATDVLAELIASRQYADWRELRFEPFTNPLVGRTLARLAVQIREALARVPATPLPSVKTPVSDAQPTTSTASTGNEQSTESPSAKKEPPTRVVDPLHRGDFTTLTDAIKTVGPGTRILLRAGLYQESLIIDKPLEIVGDGEAGEIVVQAIGTPVIKFQTTMGRIVNLTLRQLSPDNYCVDIAQGRLELEDCNITSQGRACIAIHGSADPRLRRNRIHDSKQGSGVFVYDNAQGTLEDNDIFGNHLAGIEIKTGANPTLHRNRLHDGKGSGVYINIDGQGILEDNEIFGNTLTGVEIGSGGTPTLRRNRIRDNKQSGIYVHDNGKGILEDNDVFGNGFSGITSKGGDPAVRNSRINKNGAYGIRVYEQGSGIFENNDLTGNVKGAWFISEDSEGNVKRRNNKE